MLLWRIRIVRFTHVQQGKSNAYKRLIFYLILESSQQQQQQQQQQHEEKEGNGFDTLSDTTDSYKQ